MEKSLIYRVLRIGTICISASVFPMSMAPLSAQAFQMPKAVERDGGIAIQLDAGEIRLDSPINLTRIGQERKSSGKRLALRGDPDKGTTILGSKAYTARKPFPGEILPQGINPSKNLRVIDADETVRSLWRQVGLQKLGCSSRPELSVFHADRRMNCARWPDSGYARSDTISREGGFMVDQQKAATWKLHDNLITGGYYAQDWLFEKGTISIGGSGAAKVLLDRSKTNTHYALRAPLRYFVSGAPEDMDTAGEYVSDPESGRIFLLSAENDENTVYEIPYVTTLLRVIATNNVEISDITFKYSISNTVSVSNSSNVTLKDITVVHSQAKGIIISSGTMNLVDHAYVNDIGKSGISIEGGNRKTLSASGSAIRNSVITNTSVIDRTYNAAVEISGVGIDVERNHISDTPHLAISFFGNNHLIKNNDISYTCMETADSGAVYSGRDWTERGNRIVGNYFHDIGYLANRWQSNRTTPEHFSTDTKGVYLDDMLSGTFVGYNLFANVSKPVFIGGGRDNEVVGNIFINVGPQAIHIDARGLQPNTGVDDPTSTISKRLYAVPFQSEPYLSQYPRLATLLEESPGEPRGNIIRYNIKVGEGEMFRAADGAERFIEFDHNFDLHGGMGSLTVTKFSDVVHLVDNGMLKLLPDSVASEIKEQLTVLLQKNR